MLTHATATDASTRMILAKGKSALTMEAAACQSHGFTPLWNGSSRMENASSLSLVSTLAFAVFQASQRAAKSEHSRV